MWVIKSSKAASKSLKDSQSRFPQKKEGLTSCLRKVARSYLVKPSAVETAAIQQRRHGGSGGCCSSHICDRLPPTVSALRCLLPKPAADFGTLSMITGPKVLYEFGPFRVDPEKQVLLCEDQPVAITPKAFETLLILVRHSRELVSKDELISAIWPDAFVEEGNLSQYIFMLRKALGDTHEDRHYIVTVPGRGYRFAAQVRTLTQDGGDLVIESRSRSQLVLEQTERAQDEQLSIGKSTAEDPPFEPGDGGKGGVSAEVTRVRRVWGVGLLIVLLLVAATLFVAPNARDHIWALFRSKETQTLASKPIRSLAVIPLENLSSDTSDEYFAEGMTDELITDLGQISSLRVISRTSIMQYKGVHKPLPQIAQELDVDAIVEGTVWRTGNNVRITAQLIEAPTDKHLWAQSYQGELKDVLGFQSQVASAIADQIRGKLTLEEQAAMKAGQTADPEAYEDYLEGRYFWNKRDGGGLNKAVEYFQRAAAKDPGYALAYASLAQSYVLLAGLNVPRPEVLAQAKAAAAKALSLNPNLAEAHTAMGLISSDEWNFSEAEREFRFALLLSPNNSTAHHWYGEGFLAPIGRFDEADQEMHKALALDPLSKIIITDWGVTLCLERRYPEAYQVLSKVIEMDSGFSEARQFRGFTLLERGKFDQAIAEYEMAKQIDDTPFRQGWLAYAYGVAGRRAQATSILQALLVRSRTAYVPPWSIALAYLGLGEKDHFFAWMEKSFQEHSADLVAVKVASMYDPVRDDPRFKNLVSRIKLPN
jgi:TolB-like protein/DNA-binding winged helix-turn-helix (wHTH) protein/Tfp pilus assembly protein PilF